MEDKITVKLNYCINPMMAEHLHLGGEFSIREGQTREEAWEEAIGRIEAFCQRKYGAPPPEAAAVKKDEPKDKIQAFKETLDMCKTRVMLVRFKPQVDRIGDEGLTQFYEQKLKSLQ